MSKTRSKLLWVVAALAAIEGAAEKFHPTDRGPWMPFNHRRHDEIDIEPLTDPLPRPVFVQGMPTSRMPPRSRPVDIALGQWWSPAPAYRARRPLMAALLATAAT